MPYLKPTALPSEPGRPASTHYNISANLEYCPIAQYLIKRDGNNDFVKKGNKTELGKHIEECDICQNGPAPAPLKDPLQEIVLSRQLQSARMDISLLQKMIESLQKEIETWKEKYETLKVIKANSASPVLFPHQKQKTRETMQSTKVKYLEELLKKDELEIARLKDQNIKLQNMIFGSILEGAE